MSKCGAPDAVSTSNDASSIRSLVAQTTRRLRRLMHRAGIKDAAPVHTWRHTAATELVDAGSNVKTVQARLGHSTPAITMALYVHPVDET